MKNCALLLLSILSFGCQMDKQSLVIDWSVGENLPNLDGLPHIGVAGPITGIIGDKLIVAGGANFPEAMPWDGGAKRYQKDVYVYDLDAEGKLKYIGRQDFSDSLAYAANIAVADKIISVGGERNGVATSDVIIYYLKDEKLVRQDLVYPKLPVPLTNGAVACVDNTLYFVGGENAELVSNKVYALDLDKSNASWEEFLELPKPLSHTVFVSDNEGNLYVLGGRKRNTNAKSDIYRDVLKINIKNKVIQNLEELPESLAAGTGVLYQGSILLFGGDNGDTFHKAEQLIADINLSTDDETRNNLIEKKNIVQRTHPGFTKNVWSLNLKDNTWQAVDPIIGDSPVTTTAILHNDLIVIPSGEIKAGVRTNQILVGRMR